MLSTDDWLGDRDAHARAQECDLALFDQCLVEWRGETSCLGASTCLVVVLRVPMPNGT